MSFFKDSLSLTLEPAWPWSMSGIGLPALVSVALLLIMLTVWTYRGSARASSRRITLLIALRLAALIVACLAAARPSVAFRDELHLPSTLLIVADYSESMTIQDQHNTLSRWDYLRRLLSDAEPQLQRLRDEHNITARLYRFAGQVSDYDPAGKADGKRTDFGEMLHTLFERHGNERDLRGLIILSDGADNGSRYPALSLAPKWRTLPCPIHTFGFGQTTTTSEQRDISFTDILPEPAPAVATKGKLTVKGRVDASGFENREVRVHLLINDKEVIAGNTRLQRVRDNEVKLSCDAPAEPGEIKVTLKIDPLPGEMNTANNEISTYVTVTREGISVLYVEGKVRAWEPKFIKWALAEERSIVLYEAVRDSDAPLSPDQADIFNLEKKHYDVIILGDITPKRLSAGNPTILDTMERLVFEKGTGLMMIGGYENFGQSWGDTPIAKALPVQMDRSGQIEHRISIEPTLDGLQHYVMRLADKPEENRSLWEKLKLEEMTRLGTPKLGAIVLAESRDKEPILVGQTSYGAGRTLAFAGDTTWRWHTPQTMKLHHRFWRQVVFWLAKRDKTNGNVQITPRGRRIAAGDKLDFGVKLRGKGGMEIDKDAHFEVTVVDPQKAEAKVPTARESGEERGTFWKTDLPGEYIIRARGWGTDVDGKPLENLDPAEVRFMVYQDEAEMARQGADHEFLSKLANAGGGKFHSAEELISFLKELGSTPLPQNRLKAKLWPDWRRMPASRSAPDQWNALANSGILVCFMLFVTLICMEWFLRRYWGLV